jgi:hypothetical protein
MNSVSIQYFTARSFPPGREHQLGVVSLSTKRIGFRTSEPPEVEPIPFIAAQSVTGDTTIIVAPSNWRLPGNCLNLRARTGDVLHTRQ